MPKSSFAAAGRRPALRYLPWIVAALSALLAAPAPAQDAPAAGYRLRPSATAGEALVRTETRRLAWELKQSIRLRMASGPPSEQLHELADERSDLLTARRTVESCGADGRAVRVRAEVLGHERRRTLTVDGETPDGEEAGEAEPATLAGRTLLLERRGAESAVRDAGGAALPAAPAWEPAAGPALDEPAYWLLPERAVSVGERWQVAGADLERVLAPCVAAAEEFAAVGALTGAAECRCAEIVEVDGRRRARVVYSVAATLALDGPRGLLRRFAEEAPGADAGLFAGAGLAGEGRLAVVASGELLIDLDARRWVRSDATAELALDLAVELDLARAGALRQSVAGKGEYRGTVEWRVEEH